MSPRMRFAQSESKMQAKVKDYAEETYGEKQPLGSKLYLRSVKLTMLAMMGQAGWMDLCFFCINNYTFFIEMKKPDKESTELQTERQQQLAGLGYNVYVADDVEEAKAIVDREVLIAKNAEHFKVMCALTRKKKGKTQ